MASEFSLRPLDTSYDHGIDWCEPNYVYSQYIAEFVNTVTLSATIVCMPLLILNFLYLQQKFGAHVELRFFVSCALYTISCMCNAFAHGTLFSIAGIVDEYVIFLSNVCHVYMIVFAIRTKPIPFYVFVGIFVLLVAYTLMVLFLPFAGGILTILTQVLNLAAAGLFCFVPKFNGHLFKVLKIQGVVYVGVAMAAIGSICALIDYFGCDYLEYSVLHSGFHIFIGVALQLLIVLQYYIRAHLLSVTSKTKQLVSLCGCGSFPFFVTIQSYQAVNDTDVETDTDNLSQI
mmetsp:Transcript_21504/g.34539  ORF Transcript_21504/g.34539 Transcript_21504/m.34539 type:complete len:288 (+) Transcript_21504:86-949(+)